MPSTKTSKVSSKKQSKKSTNSDEYDFSNMSYPEIDKLKFDDPKLLDNLGIEDIPNYDDLNDNEKYSKYKKLYIKLLVMVQIIELQREKIFGILSKLDPELSKDLPDRKPDSSNNNDNDNDMSNSDEEAHTKQSNTGKNKIPKKSDKNSDVETDEETAPPKKDSKTKSKKIGRG